MPLKDYEIATETIALPRGGSFVVRGLGLPAVTHLVQHHLADVLKALELYTRQKRGVATRAMMSEFAMLLCKDVPALATEIISVACEEEGVEDKIRQLPVVPQINALLMIVKLTTEEAGGLKNLVAFVAPMLRGVVNSEEAVPGTLKHKLLTSILAYGEMPQFSAPQAGAEMTSTAAH